MIRQEDLIEGEVYLTKYQEGSESNKHDYFIVAKPKGHSYKHDVRYVCPAHNSFSSGSLEYPRFHVQRMATLIEKQWMMDCISANKLLPKPIEEIVNNYELY